MYEDFGDEFGRQCQDRVLILVETLLYHLFFGTQCVN
jgi:hypothetical protein